MVIMGFDFKSQKDEIVNRTCLSHKFKGKNVKWGKSLQNTKMVVFREKFSDFSLDLRHIRPSAVFGTRRKNVLRGAGYTWTPVL